MTVDIEKFISKEPQDIALSRYVKPGEKIVALTNWFSWGGGFHSVVSRFGYVITPDKFFDDNVIQFNRYNTSSHEYYIEHPDCGPKFQGDILKKLYGEQFVFPVTEEVGAETRLVGWRRRRRPLPPNEAMI